ncbi:LuxR C-terminal-related transcriptional regulator [Kitasatospora sp. NBC_01250]|uniref:helix-turn-helix transcriptional regulator n=1 Tax=Kitasatospora sp. NBC_01250 TaxID=2903571 RepID=UPI002E367E5F|nr:LuxR C-terminal-related transcriptional regulator [Kitasatospora sp. NBC_01250]
MGAAVGQDSVSDAITAVLAVESSPPPIGDAQADTLLHDAGVRSAALRLRIIRDAAGSPLALRELAISWRTAEFPGSDLLLRCPPLTERLVRSVAPGLEHLPADTGTVVLLAAVHLGECVGDVLASAALLTGRQITVDALEPALTHGLLTLDQGRIRFRSVLVRAAVQQYASEPELLAAHAALARAIEDPYRSIWHAAQGAVHRDEQVADRLESSASEAERRRDPVEALRRWESAAHLTPAAGERARRLVRAGRGAFELGRPDLAEHLLDQAEQLGLDEEQQALSAIAWCRFTARPERGSPSVTERCLLSSRLARAGRRSAALDILVGAAEAATWTDPDPQARAALADCLTELADARSDPRWVLVQATVSPQAAQPVIARTDATEAEELWLLGTAALAVGEPGRAGDLLARAARLLRSDGRVGLLAQVQALHAQAGVLVGDWDLAQAANEEALGLADAGGQELWSIRARATRALLRAFRGDLAGSAADIASVERNAAGRRSGPVHAALRLARSVALFCSDDPSAAYQTLRPLFAPGALPHHRGAQVRTLTLLAETALRAGEVEDARQLIAGFGDGDWLPLLTAVNLAHARALLADGPDAEQHFAQALALTPRQWPWPRARTELAYGMWLRRDRRPGLARVPLREALHTFELLGATAWAEITNRELRAAGVDRGTASGHLVEQLSAQELTIARLAATGLTNREIGERLVLSPRTVGWHLHRVFPKLEVTSRAQLASLMATAA